MERKKSNRLMTVSVDGFVAASTERVPVLTIGNLGKVWSKLGTWIRGGGILLAGKTVTFRNDARALRAWTKPSSYL